MSTPGYATPFPARRRRHAPSLRLSIPPLSRVVPRRRDRAVCIVAIPHAADLPPVT